MNSQKVFELMQSVIQSVEGKASDKDIIFWIIV